MSDDTFPIVLAGREWRLPHLTFRTIKGVQPLLFDVYAKMSSHIDEPSKGASISEEQLDRLAEATWRSIATIDPGLSFQDFLDLPFSVGELLAAFPAIAQAAGLRAEPSTSATSEVSPPPGKSILTP